jgi:hypothetical protein
MSAKFGHSFGIALACGLLCQPAAFAQMQPGWVDPPADIARQSAGRTFNAPSVASPSVRQNIPAAGSETTPSHSHALPAQSTSRSTSGSSGRPSFEDAEVAAKTGSVPSAFTANAQAAVDLASAYLRAWSSPNQISLTSVSSFYGPRLMFHGQERSYQSVFVEKQRFAKRWPVRSYRHRPEVTQVACESDGSRCTVWSVFDFSAADRRHRQRSRGLGEHELVIAFTGPKPLIVAETSRVLRRGAVPRR